MRIGALAERFAGEARVALTPDSAVQLKKLYHDCVVEAGAGRAAGFPMRPIGRRRASCSATTS